MHGTLRNSLTIKQPAKILLRSCCDHYCCPSHSGARWWWSGVSVVWVASESAGAGPWMSLGEGATGCGSTGRGGGCDPGAGPGPTPGPDWGCRLSQRRNRIGSRGWWKWPAWVGWAWAWDPGEPRTPTGFLHFSSHDHLWNLLHRRSGSALHRNPQIKHGKEMRIITIPTFIFK